MSGIKVQPCWHQCQVNRKFLVLETGETEQDFALGIVFVRPARRLAGTQFKICIDLINFEDRCAFKIKK